MPREGNYTIELIISDGTIQDTRHYNLTMGIVQIEINQTEGVINDTIFEIKISGSDNFVFDTSANHKTLVSSSGSTYTVKYSRWGVFHECVTADHSGIIESVCIQTPIEIDFNLTNTLAVEVGNVNVSLPPGDVNISISTSGDIIKPYVNCTIDIKDPINTAVLNEIFNVSSTSPYLVTNQYKSLGSYEIEVICTNLVTSFNDTIAVDVLNDCFEPGGIFDRAYTDPLTPMSAYTSSDLDLSNRMQVNCDDILFLWTVKRVVEPVADPPIETNTLLTDDSGGTLRIPRGNVSQGLASVTLAVSSVSPVTTLTETMYVRFTKLPPEAFIAGGKKRSVRFNNVFVIINAREGSYDSEKGYFGDKSGLVFQWECYKVVANDLEEIESLFNAGSYGSETCNLATTTDAGNWTLDLSQGIDTQGYIVTATVVDGDLNTSYTQFLKSIPGDPPDISIVCSINCLKKTAITNMINIITQCSQCTRQVVYSWRLFNADSNVEDTDFSSKTLTANEYKAPLEMVDITCEDWLDEGSYSTRDETRDRANKEPLRYKYETKTMRKDAQNVTEVVSATLDEGGEASAMGKAVQMGDIIFNYVVQVWVYVYDYYGDSNSTYFSITVRPDDAVSGTPDPEAVKQMFSKFDDVVEKTLKGGNAMAAVGLCGSMASVLGPPDSLNGANVSEKIIEKVRSLTETIPFPVGEIQSIEESVSGTAASVDKILGNLMPDVIVDVNENFTVDSLYDQLLLDEADTIAQMRASDNYTEDDITAYEESLRNQSVELYDQKIQQRETMLAKANSANDSVPLLMNSIGSMYDVKLKLTEVGANRSEIIRDSMKVAVEKVTLDMLTERNGTEEPLGGVKLGFLLNGTGSGNDISIKQSVFEKPPYIGGGNVGSLTSKAIQIDVSDEDIVPEASIPNSNIVHARVITPTYTSGDPEGMFYIRYEIRNDDDSTMIYLKPDDLDPSGSGGTLYHLYLQLDVLPTTASNLFNQLLSLADWDDDYGLKVIIPSMPKGKYYIGFKPQEATNSSVQTGSNVSLVMTTTGCRSWDDAQQSWVSNGCQVLPFSTVNETVCRCPRQSGGIVFATTFYTAPNTIDFSTVFSKFDLSNASVYGTCLGIIVIWIIAVVLLRRQDKKDQEKWAIHFLSDGDCKDSYFYMITVETGMRRGGGTKSNVSFVLTGDDGDTGVRALDDDIRKGFPSGSARRFFMGTKTPLGPLTYLRIWHDNAGNMSEQSWFLNQVIVDDPQERQRYVFLCDRWMALEEDDGQIERVIPLSGKENITTFNTLFFQHAQFNITENHLWLSLLMRPKRSSFTRVQRASCILALLFLTMISNAMFFRSSDDNASADTVSMGGLKFSFSIFFVSIIGILITTPPIVIVTMIFKKCKPKPIKTKVKPSSDGTTGAGQSVVVLAMVFSILFKRPVEDEIPKVDVEKLKEASIVVNDGSTREETSCYMNEFLGSTKPSPKELERLKVRRQQELRASGVLVELIIYSILVFCVFGISYNNRDDRSYDMKEYIDNSLYYTGSGQTGFESVDSLDKWSLWLTSTFIPAFFPETEYNGDALGARERLYFGDITNVRVGPARLRQVRMKNDTCDYTDLTWPYPCVNSYSVFSEDEGDYCVRWTPYGGSTCASPTAVQQDKSLLSWSYTDASDIWGIPITGEYGTYGGGGYLLQFIEDGSSSQTMLERLLQNNWIDRGTRAVFLEFTVYTANVNLFLYGQFLTEFTEIGGAFTYHYVQAFRPVDSLGGMGAFSLVCYAVFIIYIIYMTVRPILKIKKDGCRKFFKDIWNWIDLVCAILSYSLIAVFGVRLNYAKQAMAKYYEELAKPNSEKDIINFQHIVVWDNVFNIILGILVFIITLRVLRILGYNRRLQEVSSVVSHASTELIGFVIVFGIIFSAYISLGFLLFTTIEEYKSLFAAWGSLTNTLIGKNSFDKMVAVSPNMAQFYYFTFVFCVLMSLATMFAAILNKSISEIKDQTKQAEDEFGILDFLIKMLKSIVGIAYNPTSKPIQEPNPKGKQPLIQISF
ncbi:hypothetical protein FSP39_004480 [Pinctada imbricata]|uniref:PLAT domain-containing protein n=1 Tax=Pinctada imbricata TaxID=66713 RepID=A0AA89BNK5_PINIB|nr:hypothetical protein FSP39_004480 [Pinctada imbricata]